MKNKIRKYALDAVFVLATAGFLIAFGYGLMAAAYFVYGLLF